MGSGGFDPFQFPDFHIYIYIHLDAIIPSVELPTMVGAEDSEASENTTGNIVEVALELTSGEDVRASKMAKNNVK